MRVYLKNGQKMRISQSMANEITEMKIEQANNPKTAQNLLVRRHMLSKNIYSIIDIDEVIAIN